MSNTSGIMVSLVRCTFSILKSYSCPFESIKILPVMGSCLSETAKFTGSFGCLFLQAESTKLKANNTKALLIICFSFTSKSRLIVKERWSFNTSTIPDYDLFTVLFFKDPSCIKGKVLLEIINLVNSQVYTKLYFLKKIR